MTPLPDDVRALFEGPNYAHLATVLPSGAPHSVPVWTGIEAHRPLGAINRARQEPYRVSSQFRADFNRCPIHEPSSHEAMT